MGSNLQVHDVVVAEVQTGALCALCLNGPTDQLRLFSTKFKHRLKRC